MGRVRPFLCMVALPDPGVRVSATVVTHNETVQHVGLVLPPAAKGHLSIKLDNGYNVSYPAEDVQAWEHVPVKDASPSAELDPPTADEHLPRVRLIHTGGTIASKVDYATGAVEAKFEPEEMLDAIPELASIAQLDAVKIGNMFSDDIRPQHWNIIAAACADAFEDGCRGVVIAHGTDTLHITSAALSFAFAGSGARPAGPIVMVGSQRSSDRGSSDATENLLAAVHWAASGPLPTGAAAREGGEGQRPQLVGDLWRVTLLVLVPLLLLALRVVAAAVIRGVGAEGCGAHHRGEAERHAALPPDHGAVVPRPVNAFGQPRRQRQLAPARSLPVVVVFSIMLFPRGRV